jgi:hypothetical protein
LQNFLADIIIIHYNCIYGKINIFLRYYSDVSLANARATVLVPKQAHGDGAICLSMLSVQLNTIALTRRNWL